VTKSAKLADMHFGGNWDILLPTFAVEEGNDCTWVGRGSSCAGPMFDIKSSTGAQSGGKGSGG